MRWLDYQRLPVKSLVLPGDIRQRMKEPHVIELAASMRGGGGDPIHAPTINGDTNVLIAGRDRMAALLLNKATKVWCHVAVEVTEDDARNLEVDENLHRRHDDRDALIARKVAKTVESLERDAQLPVAKTGRGAPRTIKGQAREKVARELGTTPEAIRSAERRAAEPEVEEAAEAPSLLGRNVDDYNAAIDEIATGLRAVQRLTSKLAGHATLPVAPFERLKQELQRAMQIAEGARLVAKCPVCAGTEAPCALCGDVRFVTQFQLAGVPKDEATVHRQVSGRGQPPSTGMYPIQDAPRTMLKAPKPRVKVELSDGSEFNEPVEDTESDLF